MNPDDWQRITAVFHQALEQHATAREGFLDAECGAEPNVREQVERLLAAHENAGRFGEEPLPIPSDLWAKEATAAADATVAVAVDEPTDGLGVAGGHNWFQWIARGALVLTLAAFAYGAFALATGSAHAPDLGWTETRSEGIRLVSAVDPAGPAAGRLQAGDVLLALEGGSVATRVGTRLYRRALAPGDDYRLTVGRADRRIDVQLTVGEGQRVRTERFTYFTIALAWCLVGLFIGFARPDSPSARLASMATWVTGIVYLDFIVLKGGPLLHPLHVLLGYHFFCRFPTGRRTAGAWRWSLVLLYGAGAVSVAAGLVFWVAQLVDGVAGMGAVAARYPRLMGLRPGLATIVFDAALLLTVVVAATTYRGLRSEDQRRRVRWLVLGAVVGLMPQVIWALSQVIVGLEPVAWMGTAANLFTVVVPVSAAYAVVRHRVFDIKVVVRRGLQYLLARRVLQGAVALPVVALGVTLVRNRELTLTELAGETRGYLFWIAASALILSVRAPLQRSLDRRFFREQYDREHLLLEILEGVSRVGSISELAHVVHEQLTSALHPTTAYVWYRDPEELAFASGTNPLLTPADVPSDGSWLPWLERRGEAAALPFPPEAGVSRREAAWFAERGIGLLIPIMDGGDSLVGAVMLGDKRSEEPYSAGDTKLLSAVARQAAVVRENLRLRARVGEELRVRHEVLARLDARVSGVLKECPRCGSCFDGAVERCAHDDEPLTLTLPIGRIVAGRYRLDRVLGKGGMGAVYTAEDLQLRRAVAVKVLLGRSFGQQDALRRFRREARATAQLTHPNIVTVHDYGPLDGDGAFLVMELVPGVTLRAELERRTALPHRDAAQWFGPMLSGVAAAHRAGVVHRDLKPENVMGRPGASGVHDVKVLDLGLAKLRPAADGATGTSTAHGVVMGTLAYMAPEQLAGREVDVRADVYSLGIVLVEVLTGERPLSALDPKRPAALEGWAERVDLPASQRVALDAVVRRCVANDPQDRFASAEELAERLLPALH